MKLRSLKVLLPSVILAAMLAMTLAASVLNYTGFRDQIVAYERQLLSLALADKGERISTLFAEMQNDMAVRARSGEPRDGIVALSQELRMMTPEARSALVDAYVTRNPNPPGTREKLTNAMDGSTFSFRHAEMIDYFVSAADEHGYYDVFLIDVTGDVLFSVEKETDFLANVATGELAASGLGEAFKRALVAPAGTVVFADYRPYGPSAGALAAFLAVPVTDAQGKVLGVYAAQVPDMDLSGRATAEINVVGEDGLIRAWAGMEGQEPLSLGDQVTLSEPMRRAFAGESGVMQDLELPDGQQVMLAYAPIEVMGVTWAMTAHVDQAVIFAPLATKKQFVVIELLAVLVCVMAFGWLVTRWIVGPLTALGAAVSQVAGRVLDITIPGTARRDEVGHIAREVETLRQRQIEARAKAVEAAYMSEGFRKATVAMMIVDRAGVIRFANGAAADLFRANAEELRRQWPGFNPDALVGTEIAQFHRNHAGNMARLSDANSLPMETEVNIGELKLSLTISAVMDETGGYVGNVVVWEDVGQQRKTAGIIDAIRRNQVMIELDTEARIVEVNAAACAIYGYAREEMLGMPFSRLMFKGEAGLAELMTKLQSEGFVAQRHHRISKTGREIWVDCMLNAIRDGKGKVFRIIAICSDVTEVVQRQEAAAEADRVQRAAQGHVVQELGLALGNLAEGDLRQRIEAAFPAEYEALRGNFNAAVDRLAGAMALVVEGAANIRSGAAEITDAADDLSRRTESQAATLEQTAAALDELTLSVKSAAEGAADADRTVKSAREQAEASGAVVIEAVSAMSEIEKSSRQISQIIGVIDDIAFQTNLLALNAGVEAARAGEAGRGFAVVASEVRALAQRSSEAAKEIKQLISSSSRQVENGVGLVGQTGEALKTIVAGVTEIATRVSAIAQSSREQATGLTEINAGVSMLDQVTQQNAAMVEESTAASHSLRQEAEGLAELVARFRLEPQTAVAAPVAAVPAPRRAAVASAGGRSTRADWARDAGQAAGGGSGWEEF